MNTKRWKKAAQTYVYIYLYVCMCVLCTLYKGNNNTKRKKHADKSYVI